MARIIAHRGASGLRPENTIAAFAKALEIGVAGIELDVQLSADGRVVVYHDLRLNPEVTRDSQGSWLEMPGPPIRHLNFTDLRGYDVGRLDPRTRYARRYPDQLPADGERIPTLEEVIALLKSFGAAATLWIELKTDPEQPQASADPDALADTVVTLLQANDFIPQAVLISFDWRGLLRARQRSADVSLGFLSAERSWLDNIRRRSGRSPWTAGFDIAAFNGSLPRMIRAAGGRYWSVYFRDLRPKELTEARALGLGVNVWTLRRPADKTAFTGLEADFITTDRPDWFR